MNTSRLNQALCTFALSACALAAAPAHAYSDVFIFGDSLSDTGNVGLALQVLGGIPNASLGVADQPIDNVYIPDAPYPITGGYDFATFSNGPVWASKFAGKLGLKADPTLATLFGILPGATNFSFAGARTGADTDVPSIKTQVNTFLSMTGGFAPGSALYVIGGGGNDARDGVEAAVADIMINGTDPATATFAAGAGAAASYAADVELMVHQLQGAGAQNILVFGVPNLGLTPALTTLGLSAIGSGVSGLMDAKLFEVLADDNVKIFDAYSFISGVVADVLSTPGGAHGFKNATDACGAAAPETNCDEYVFWDGIHPTAAMHRMLADTVYAQAVPEPETYALMALGLVAVGFAARRRQAKA
jgi:outer membrane lipase/esterase